MLPLQSCSIYFLVSLWVDLNETQSLCDNLFLKLLPWVINLKTVWICHSFFFKSQSAIQSVTQTCYCSNRRSKERSKGSGGGGTCRDTWALTPNTNTRLLAAATTSAPRSPCWHDAVQKHAGVHPPVAMTCLAYDSHKQWYRHACCRKYSHGRKDTTYISSSSLTHALVEDAWVPECKRDKEQ